MKNLILKLTRHKWTAISFALSYVFVLTGWIWSWIRLRSAGELTLHFSLYSGINRTGTILDLHAFGLLGLIILSLNWMIAEALEERDWFLGKLTSFISLDLGTLIFIGFMVIMNIN